MLTKIQIQELKEHLEKAQNPLFYYDNDCDGLCSYLLLRRFFGKGKGVAVRSYPDLDASYARKAKELNADYVFILDKPVVSKDFFELISELHLPIIWIDHHEINRDMSIEKKANISLYNCTLNFGEEKSEEPVTYWCYKLTNRKEDVWLAIIGCIADHYLPDFVEYFKERFSEFWGEKIKEPFDAYYKTEIGRIAQAFNFGLKDSTTHIVHLQNFLTNVKGPEEVFLEVKENYSFRKKYQEIKNKYDSLVEKAKKCLEGELLFFDYAGDLSISSDIANELSYLYPKKYIVVCYKKGTLTNVSLRGKNVREILKKILPNLKNSSGGGHENAVGARIQTSDIFEFKKMLAGVLND